MARDSFFDVLKGYAILLVALGHSIQFFSNPTFTSDPVFLYIYMFHMPLFFFVAGRFVIKSCEKSNFRDFALSKARHLVIPAIAWGIISWIVNVYLYGNTDLLSVKRFAGVLVMGYWFLTTLFAMSILAAVIHLCIKKTSVRYAIWIVLLAAMSFINESHMNGFTTMAPFFAIALAIRNVDFKTIPWYIHLGNFVLFGFLYANFKFEYTFYAKPGLGLMTSVYWFAEFMRLASGCSGILLSLGICAILTKIPFLPAYLCRIGMLTLPIYCMHQLLMIFSHNTLGLSLHSYGLQFAAAIIAIEISILIYKVLTKSAVLGLIYFGERKQKL